MKEVTFKKEGLIFKIHGLSYSHRELPKDTCTYKQQLIVAFTIGILLLPLTILRLLIRKIDSKENLFIPGFLGYVVNVVVIVFFLISGSIFLDEGQSFSYLLWWHPIVGSLIVISVVAAVFAIGLGMNWLSTEFFPKKMKIIKEKTKDFDSVKLYKSWKEKYCSKINWK